MRLSSSDMALMAMLGVASIVGGLLIVAVTSDSMLSRFPVCPEDSRGYYIPYGSQREGDWWTRYECVPPEGAMICAETWSYCRYIPDPADILPTPEEFDSGAEQSA